MNKRSYLLIVLVPEAGEHEGQERLVGESHRVAAAAVAPAAAAPAAHTTLAAATATRRPTTVTSHCKLSLSS